MAIDGRDVAEFFKNRMKVTESPKTFVFRQGPTTGQARLKAMIKDAVTEAIREELPWMIEIACPTYSDSRIADSDEYKKLTGAFDKNLKSGGK